MVWNRGLADLGEISAILLFQGASFLECSLQVCPLEASYSLVQGAFLQKTHRLCVGGGVQKGGGDSEVGCKRWLGARTCSLRLMSLELAEFGIITTRQNAWQPNKLPLVRRKLVGVSTWRVFTLKWVLFLASANVKPTLIFTTKTSFLRSVLF